MSRKDALLRLHEQLVERRRDILRSLADELGDLRHDIGGQTGADDADAAFDTLNTELTSQLAQLEYRELAQIERALASLRKGNYGSCEVCGVKIPVARLNALPYSTACINCQRLLEENPSMAEEQRSAWAKVYDSEAASRDMSSVKLNDLEYNVG